MGRNKLVKRLVLLLLLITCIVSVVIFFNLYVISSSELQTFPTWVNVQEKRDDSIEKLDKDPDIIELEKKIDYILKLYEDGKQPNLGLAGVVNHLDHTKNLQQRVSENSKEAGGLGVNIPKFKPVNFQFAPRSKVPRTVKITEKKKSASVPGILNAHIWEGWCGPRVEDLKRDKHFPLYPSFKTNLSLFFAQWNEAGYGERIFGYLHPPETGNYIFAVSCDDNCEIWLSNSSNPLQVQKIAYVGTLNTPANTQLANFRQYQSQISKQFYMVGGNRYYIEALHKQAAYKDHLLLAWLAPSWQRIRTISSKYISSFISGDMENVGIQDYAMYIPETQATVGEQIYDNIGNIYYFNRTKYKFGSCDESNQNITTDLVKSTDFINILPPTDYKPSYVIDFVPKRYEGVKLIHESSVYPNDNTALTHMYSYEDCLTHRQNHPHLRELFPASSLKTSIDEENWFSQLNFNNKFKYLLNLYNKKIKYIVHQQNVNSKTKTSDMVNKLNKFDVESKSIKKAESQIPMTWTKPNEDAMKNNKSDPYSYKMQSNFPKKLPTESSEKKVKGMSVTLEKSYDMFGSSNLKIRKLLNVKKDSEEEEELDGSTLLTKKYLYSEEAIHIKKVKVKSYNMTRNRVRYKKKSYSDVDNDVLPQNLLENSIRDNPISIPTFVKSPHAHNPNLKFYTANMFQKNTQEPFVNHISKKRLRNQKRIQHFLPRRRLKIHPMIDKKIYFKDGMFMNGTNITSPDHSQMGWLYNIYGSAIYHLTQIPERYFLWMYNQQLSDCKTDGNLQLSEEIALNVVYEYMEAVKIKHGSKYTLKRIINVEENHDVIHGDRYLIEIDIAVENQQNPQHLSRYIYRPIGSHKLFEINDFQWNPYATVHIIIPVKDQGRWVKHFINNMENIYTTIKDPYLNIILVDFNSTDIDINKSLKKVN